MKILTTREEKKLPKYNEDDAGYSQPEFPGTRCQREKFALLSLRDK
jgi:hypothetical protein